MLRPTALDFGEAQFRVRGGGGQARIAAEDVIDGGGADLLQARFFGWVVDHPARGGGDGVELRR